LYYVLGVAVPKSFRIDPVLERRLEEVARRQEVPVSVVVREAIAKHCDEVLGEDLRSRLADVIGVVHGGGGRAARTGEAFKQLLAERARR
jgi:predicted DNA-binding protein